MTSIIIVGVGGQGTLLASRIIGHAATAAGFDAKVSEVHGMSQRGGGVETYVRYGRETVASPVIGRGGADLALCFELLEGYRVIPYVKPGGKILINTRRINPMPVITGQAQYPGGILEKIRAKGFCVTETDALALAESAGNAKCVNVALIGMLAAASPDFTKEEWLAALSACVPEKLREVNLRAFELGYSL